MNDEDARQKVIDEYINAMELICGPGEDDANDMTRTMLTNVLDRYDQYRAAGEMPGVEVDE